MPVFKKALHVFIDEDVGGASMKLPLDFYNPDDLAINVFHDLCEHIEGAGYPELEKTESEFFADGVSSYLFGDFYSGGGPEDIQDMIRIYVKGGPKKLRKTDIGTALRLLPVNQAKELVSAVEYETGKKLTLKGIVSLPEGISYFIQGIIAGRRKYKAPWGGLRKLFDVFYTKYTSFVKSLDSIDRTMEDENFIIGVIIDTEKMTVQFTDELDPSFFTTASMNDQQELDFGTKEEMEHTDDPRIAEKIAKDHLKEDSNYYDKLKNCGLTEADSKTVKQFSHEIERSFPGVQFDLSGNDSPGSDLELMLIEVPESSRGKGSGSQIMKRLCKFADSRGSTIKLKASEAFGESDIGTLVSWYSKFGFKKVGSATQKSKDSHFEQLMVREPK